MTALNNKEIKVKTKKRAAVAAQIY